MDGLTKQEALALVQETSRKFFEERATLRDHMVAAIVLASEVKATQQEIADNINTGSTGQEPYSRQRISQLLTESGV